MVSRKLFIASVGVAALGLSLALAGPSYAAQSAAPTLPANDKFFAVNCNDPGDPSVWSVLTTGAATPLGTDTAVTCGYGGAYDSLTDSYYFLDGSNTTSLAKFDPSTGAVTQIGALNGSVTDGWQLVIDDASNGYLTNGNDVHSINLSTATTTLIGSIGFNANFGAAAFNPVDKRIYGFGNLAAGIFTIDPATGAGTVIYPEVRWAQVTCPDGFEPGSTGELPDSAAFDSNGIAWIQMDKGCNSDLLAWDPLTNSSWSTGVLHDATQLIFPTAPHDFYSETYIIGRYPNAPAPAVATLATTGVNFTAVGMLAGAAALVAAFGTGALLTSRRRRLTGQ